MSALQVKKVHTLTGHKDALYVLEKYDAARFFSAGGDGMVVLWDLQEPETGQMIVKVPASVYSIVYDKAKQVLIVGQNFSGIHLADVESRQETGSLALTKAAIFDIKTTDHAIYVATGDGEVIEVSWDLHIRNRVRHSERSARTMAVNPERSELAVGYSDHYIRIFDLKDLSLKKEFLAHQISVFTLRYHPQFPLLMSGSRDARFKLWDTDRDYALVDEVVAHMYAINHLEFSPDGRFFATCSMDKSVKLWDAGQFRLLKVIDRARHAGHGTSVNKLLWMDYANWLLSCSDDRTISVWDILDER